MDENYLDSLLNEVSLDKEIDHKIEEELDNQMQQEKRQYQEQQLISDEELFNLDLELDVNDMLPEQDVHFSEAQMDELDHLDSLADLDIGDLDFSDIDFDDLDVTKLDGVETEDLDDLLKDFEGDLDVANLFDTQQVSPEQSLVPEQPMSTEQQADLNEDSFDTDQFLDSLLEEDTVPAESVGQEFPEITEDVAVTPINNESVDTDEDYDLLQALEEFGGFEEAPKQEEPVGQLSDAEQDDLDDILSMLDLDGFSTDEDSSGANPKATKEEEHADRDINIDDFEELPASKQDKKQQLMEMLFGEPDEDDILSEEELAEIEAKKAAKKLKKEEAKKAKEEKAQAAKEVKSAKNNQKKKAEQEKKLLKAQKKQLLRAEALAEAANEKKLNKPMVIFIFTLFLGATLLFLVSTNNFNYSLAIEKATNYFANQKYRKAYDEIVGVEVKEKDEDLKDRIYTVMYVERLYESYLNNMELGRREKALDSLLRGVSKYYEHYQEAQELGITSDLDYSFNQIKTVLNDQYGITVEQAIEINQLDDYEYVQYIQSIVGDANIDAGSDNRSEEGQTAMDQTSEEVALPEEKEEEVEE